jgi:hypothetical protein
MNLLAFASTDIWPAHQAAAGGGVKGILVMFLICIVVLAVVAGLIWAIETFIHALPDMLKLVIAIVLVVCVLIWAVSVFM